MSERVLFPEWRFSNETTKFPFADRASLANATGQVLLEGTFLDAILYPIGATAGIHLARVDIDHQTVALVLGDRATRQIASGSFALVAPPDAIALTDAFGRPAGLLVSEARRLGIFQSWGVGSHVFTAEQTEFAGTVCIPTPAPGLRGIQLDDGSILAGEIWLVGDDGVVLRAETVQPMPGCGPPAPASQAIRIDVVGDPLFRRRLCVPNNLFQTPRILKAIRVVSPQGTFTCGPDDLGNLLLVAGNSETRDSVLRIHTTADGIAIGVNGQAP